LRHHFATALPLQHYAMTAELLKNDTSISAAKVIKNKEKAKFLHLN